MSGSLDSELLHHLERALGYQGFFEWRRSIFDSLTISGHHPGATESLYYFPDLYESDPDLSEIKSLRRRDSLNSW